MRPCISFTGAAPTGVALSLSSLVQVAYAVVRGAWKRPSQIELNNFKCPPALRRRGLTDSKVLDHFKDLPDVQRPQLGHSLELYT